MSASGPPRRPRGGRNRRVCQPPAHMRIAMLLHKSVEFDSRVRREASALAGAGHDVAVLELTPVAGGAASLDGFMRRSVLPAAWLRRRLPFNLYRMVFFVTFVRGIVRARP